VVLGVPGDNYLKVISAGTRGSSVDMSVPSLSRTDGSLYDQDAVKCTKAFDPIDICGMACRLPGEIQTPQELWNFLLSKGDAPSIVPNSRYNISAWYSDDTKPGSSITQYGYFLDESVDLGALDTSIVAMPRGEVESMDPQQRLLLEVTREYFEDAGEVEWRGKNIGAYVGSFGNDAYDLFQRRPKVMVNTLCPLLLQYVS
jgi:acyl transferase domain-containing protein